ncbi:MAG: hypothetical protein IJ218_02970 [Alphaproteobacteria bacterium]|nr:hypothetical protein [Alphaproteobacteria bacterium]
MKNNPFAAIFRDAFYKDVLDGSIYMPNHNTEHPARVKSFMRQLNRFISTAGEAPIMYPKYAFNEHKLFEYALFLRGYMRDSQNVLAHLEQKYAIDKDLIALFKASSEYVVACNGKIGDKRTFDNNVGYKVWKADLSAGLQNATYEQVVTSFTSERHNLFLFMPFRVKGTEEMLSKWMYVNMRQSLDNSEFKHNIDTYAIHYPIQKSRCSNITSVLKTLRFNDTFYEKEDMAFVKNHWLPFVAENIELNDQNKVIAADSFVPSTLMKKFKNITIFSYCAGTANAHRCLNALYDITQQIYGNKIADTAMQNIFVNSYGFLPVRDKLRYSGIHFYTNATQDDNRREPFVNLNNHTLYEKTKVTNKKMPARLSVLPDERNYILAFKLSDKIAFWENSQVREIVDAEFGHNMVNISTPNLNNGDNYAYNVFKNVLINSSLGKRGGEVLQMTEQTSAHNLLTHSMVQAQLQKIHS